LVAAFLDMSPGAESLERQAVLALRQNLSHGYSHQGCQQYRQGEMLEVGFE